MNKTKDYERIVDELFDKLPVTDIEILVELLETDEKEDIVSYVYRKLEE